MRKNFVRKPSKSYSQITESLSDTEVDVRKSSSDRLAESFLEELAKEPQVGDGFGTSSASRGLFKPLKIRDEIKLDLKKSETSAPSIRSLCKIFTIDEVSENASRASSKMQFKREQDRQAALRIFEANKSAARNRPTSRLEPSKPEIKSSATQVASIEIFKPVYRSLDSFVESEFAEEFDKKVLLPKDFYPSDSTFGSVASFKRDHFRRFSHDVSQYRYLSQPSLSKADSSKMLTIRTYSTASTTKTSCFSALTKPFAKLCSRKSKKN